MQETLSNWGWDASEATAIFVLCTAYVFTVVSIIWAIGLSWKNHSMMDGYYGWAYASVGWIAFLMTNPVSPYAALLLLMTSLHGVRLGYYLSARWLGYRKIGSGDARYAGFYENLQPHYWLKSFFIVLQPQTIVIMVISLPAVYGIVTMANQSGPLSPLAYLGMVIFGIGSYFEWIADGQLQAFKADPNNKGRYLETGVWALTRHPNYFGNVTVWWGIYIVAVAGNPDLWWTVAGPIFNTVMLTKVLGTAFQDRHMGDRPEYQELMKKRGGFLPKLW